MLIFESIKVLEIKTSMLFNLDFPNNTVLSYCIFFFLIIGLYFLIPAVIAQIFNPIAELVLPKGIQSIEVKAETEMHPVVVFNII